VISITNLQFSFENLAVIHQLSLNISGNSIHGLIGASGSGKSTLLRLIAGLLQPKQGEIRIKWPREVEDAKYLSQKLGFVIQDGGLFPHMNVVDNMTLMATMLNWSSVEIQNRVDELISLTNFDTQLLTKKITQISGGQRQRLSLMRALFLKPPLLLMDEPLGALDPLLRSEIQHDLKTILKKLKTTAVLVTHDLPEASFLCDQISLLKDGQLEQSCSITDFFSKPKTDYVKKYIDSQRMIGS